MGRPDGSAQGPDSKKEPDQHMFTIKPEKRPHDGEFDQDQIKNEFAASVGARESLREFEKENQEREGKTPESNSIKGEVDLISDSGEPSKAAFAKELGYQDDEKVDGIQGEEKQPRKRKRNIMSDRQINLIEKALLDEPEMQRNSALLQSWADTLSAQVLYLFSFLIFPILTISIKCTPFL